jgi:hypothetical protein
MGASDSDGAQRRGAKSRELVWIEEEGFAGWGCSECTWVFEPSVGPPGKTLDEMTGSFELQRDKEFRLHVCAEQGHVEARVEGRRRQ